MTFPEQDKEILLSVFQNSLESLKFNQGVDLEKAFYAHRSCLLIVTLVISILYEPCNCYGFKLDVPHEIRELQRDIVTRLPF